MTPRLTLLIPEHFCRGPEWDGTTNLFHVILHGEEVPEDVLDGILLKKQFSFGLALFPLFSPPRWTEESGLGLLVTAQADVGAIQPYRIPSGGNQKIASSPITRVTAGVDVASFILRVPEDHMGTVSILARVVWNGIVLAEIDVVDPTSHHGGEKEEHRRRRAFAKIFASYSRTDLEMVKLFGNIISSSALADLQWDLKFLRPGEDWWDGICREILDADSFQLFWSKAASESSNVKDEWTFALQNREKGFIKPIYWVDPLTPPPVELGHIHFGKVDIAPLRAITAAASGESLQ